MAVDDLSKIEHEMRSLWTADDATPFIADLQLSDNLLHAACKAARQFPINLLLDRYPTLGVWAVLFPLAKNYAAKDREIYSHLESFLGQTLPSAERGTLKSRFISAARRIGIPIASSTDPTKVFFAPLGAPEPQHLNLANAFLSTAIYKGPPAVEDTVAARHWQRVAVSSYCFGQPRLQEPIWFDESAHYARRFDAWRRGEDSAGPSEEALFKAYSARASRMGRQRSDFVGPPSLIWHRDSLGLLAEKSSRSQSIKQGLFPTPIASGKRISIDPPWPETISWSSGVSKMELPFAPKGQEVLVFDADSGALIQRVNELEQTVEAAAKELVVLSKLPFSCLSFGQAIETIDQDLFVAWIENGETLSFQDRASLQIGSPVDTAVWFEGTVVGRNGANALYSNDLKAVLRLDAKIGGAERILRARIGPESRFVRIKIDASSEAQVAFAEFGFDRSTDPSKIVFEVLVPGAAGDMNARADLKAQCWVWPGVAPPDGDISNVPVPSNYEPARSAGLHVDSYARISVDERAEAETPILGLTFEDQSYEFDLVARSEKLWHFRVDKNDQVFVPKGSTVNFGYDNRHDMLRLRCFDRDADLIVLGRPINRPFIQRQVFEIGAEKLEVDTGDDRIAIRRVNGKIELLARLRRITDTASLSVEETEEDLVLNFRASEGTQAIRVTHQPVSGSDVEGDYSFGVFPVSIPPIPGISVHKDPTSSRVSVEIKKADMHGPGRILLKAVSGSGATELMKDASNAPIALGITGSIDTPSRATLVRLASFLAYPDPEALGGQVSSALYEPYANAFAKIGQNRRVGSIRPVLNITRDDGGTARHDVVGVAPWIFEAGAHALSGLSEGTGFSSLGLMTSLASPDPRPDLDCAHPLGDWLDRVKSDAGIPEGLDAAGLQDAFGDLRFRLREMDMNELCGDGVIGNTCRIICGAHTENLAKLRTFDLNGGGDPFPAKIAIQIERFARAAAQERTEDFLEELIARTGLSKKDIGYAMSMMLRAGVRFFVYFRALWGAANIEGVSVK